MQLDAVFCIIRKSESKQSRAEKVMEKYELRVLSEKYAKEICTWKYDGDYAIYNFSDWDIVVEKGWDLADKHKRETDFAAVLLEDMLVAYGVLTSKEGKAFIGIGLAPSLCGKGRGKDIMKLLIAESKRRFPGCLVVLEVRSFNERAIKCYKNIGFEIIDKYVRDTPTGDGEFYFMEYVGSEE